MGSRPHFYGRINQKLMANRDILAEIYSFAASHGLTFNYPTKRAVSWAVDSGDLDAYRLVIERQSQGRRDLRTGLLEIFVPLSQAQTKELLLAETTKPTKLRKAHGRAVRSDVFEAAAGSLLWSLWDSARLRRAFRPDAATVRDTGDYLADLRASQPALYAPDLEGLAVEVLGT